MRSGEAAYAYLIYPHKPIVSYVPRGVLLSEYCAHSIDLLLEGPGLRPRPGAPVEDGRGAGQVQGTADGGAARGAAEHGREVREMGDVAHAGRAEGDRDRQRREHGPAVERWRRALVEGTFSDF